MRMRDRRRWGGGIGPVLVLLALLSGLGAWNYHRNWQLELEADGGRPYSAYSRSDVEALREAYQAELIVAQARFEAAHARRVRPQLEMGSFSQHVDQFSRTTHQSAGIRSAADSVSRQKQEIAHLERELSLRSPSGGAAWTVHLQRLVTL